MTPPLLKDQYSLVLRTPLCDWGKEAFGNGRFIRNIDSRICDRYFDHIVTSLPSVKAAAIMCCLHTRINSAREESEVVVLLGTNYFGKCCCVVLEKKLGH